MNFFFLISVNGNLKNQKMLNNREEEEKPVDSPNTRPIFSAPNKVGIEQEAKRNQPAEKEDVNCCFARHCLCWMDWVESLLNRIKTS